MATPVDFRIPSIPALTSTELDPLELANQIVQEAVKKSIQPPIDRVIAARHQMSQMVCIFKPKHALKLVVRKAIRYTWNRLSESGIPARMKKTVIAKTTHVAAKAINGLTGVIKQIGDASTKFPESPHSSVVLKTDIKPEEVGNLCYQTALTIAAETLTDLRDLRECLSSIGYMKHPDDIPIYSFESESEITPEEVEKSLQDLINFRPTPQTLVKIRRTFIATPLDSLQYLDLMKIDIERISLDPNLIPARESKTYAGKLLSLLKNDAQGLIQRILTETLRRTTTERNRLFDQVEGMILSLIVNKAIDAIPKDILIREAVAFAGSHLIVSQIETFFASLGFSIPNLVDLNVSFLGDGFVSDQVIEPILKEVILLFIENTPAIVVAMQEVIKLQHQAIVISDDKIQELLYGKKQDLAASSSRTSSIHATNLLDTFCSDSSYFSGVITSFLFASVRNIATDPRLGGKGLQGLAQLVAYGLLLKAFQKLLPRESTSSINSTASSSSSSLSSPSTTKSLITEIPGQAEALEAFSEFIQRSRTVFMDVLKEEIKIELQRQKTSIGETMNQISTTQGQIIDTVATTITPTPGIAQNIVSNYLGYPRLIRGALSQRATDLANFISGIRRRTSVSSTTSVGTDTISSLSSSAPSQQANSTTTSQEATKKTHSLYEAFVNKIRGYNEEETEKELLDGIDSGVLPLTDDEIEKREAEIRRLRDKDDSKRS